jgi:uncharacterized protein with gpF-like domain
MAANRWEDLVNQWSDDLQKAFLAAVYQLREQAQIDVIATMLERGDVDGAIRAVGLDPISFRPFDKAFTDAFEAGGNATANIVPITRNAEGFRLVVQFAIRNPRAEAWLKDQSSSAVTEVLNDQRTMIREHLTAGMEKGVNPKTAALDLVGRVSAATGRREGGVIGLTSTQAEWVRNYSDELASDNPLDALARTLRDKRFDGAVRKAAKAGQPVPADLQAKMVASYKNRALRYRGEVISRTEAMSALHHSQEEAMQQAVDAGGVQQSVVAYTWRATKDGRTRDTHREMDGQVKPMGQLFVSPSGARLRYPGDANAPASEIVNCRCWREPKIDFFAGVD